MTSTLPANNHFGKDFFSGSSLHGRSVYSNSFTVDSNIPSMSLAANIWQPSQNDLKPLRTQIARNGDLLVDGINGIGLTKSDCVYENSRESAAITSRARGTFQATSNTSGKQSPVVYQGTSSSSTEPLSANSRSNNDSAILTPSSNISISDQFPVQTNTVQDVKQSRIPKSQSHQTHSTVWSDAKEFRPKLSLMSDRLPSTDGTLKLSTTDGNVSSNTRRTTFNRVWTQQDLDTGYNASSVRCDFRPVLPASSSVSRKHKYQAQTQTNGYGIDRQTYDSDRLFNNTATEPYQPYYQPATEQRYHFAADPMRTYSHPIVADERGLHANNMNPINWRNYSERQLANYRHLQISQPIPNTAEIHANNFDPEDYYRKPVEDYRLQPMSSRAGPGSQALRQYDHYYPEDDGFGMQRFSPMPGQYSIESLQDNRNAYYMEANGNLQYIGHDSAQERAPEIQQIYRSPLLEEFRLNKSRKYELKDIYDHVVEFSGDQLGSRFIQQKLEVANSDEKDRIFGEIARDSRQLMTDVFGNYVIQKMFEHGNQSQKRLLASHMKGHVYALSLQTYGCRVVQKAFEHILTDQQGSLIKELDGNVLKVVENQNGNHVIQKAIEMIPGEHIQFIVDAHQGHVHQLSKHPYGCRVIQRMLEFCQPHAKRQILDELLLNISELIQDAFGNYVVQHVIVNGELSDRKIVIDKVQGKLLENAMHKFASNVVEKALDHADEHQRRVMLQKLTGRDEAGQSTTTKLLTHQYGNYVIQKSTSHLSGQTLATTIEEMENYLSQLQRVSSGKQVSALQKSILQARNRLDSQRYNPNNLHYAPTHPRTGYGRR